MTDTERERLAGLTDVEEIKVYQAKSRVRRRIEEELTFDVEILAEHHPELLDELREVVCEQTDSDTSGDEPERDSGQPTPTSKDDINPTEFDPGLEELSEEPAEEVSVDEALRGWSYGRTDKEQQANDSVAAASLEWLRDTGDAVRQSDVPLDELAEDDPLDRTPDTLWRSVIRGAWQHAVGLGYIEKPDSRAYRWVGANE